MPMTANNGKPEVTERNTGHFDGIPQTILRNIQFLFLQNLTFAKSCVTKCL